MVPQKVLWGPLSFFIKSLRHLKRPATLLRREFNTGAFLWNLRNLRTPISKNNFKQLLLLNNLLFSCFAIVDIWSRGVFTTLSNIYVQYASGKKAFMKYQTKKGFISESNLQNTAYNLQLIYRSNFWRFFLELPKMSNSELKYHWHCNAVKKHQI